jgi:hypothetical protein
MTDSSRTRWPPAYEPGIFLPAPGGLLVAMRVSRWVPQSGIVSSTSLASLASLEAGAADHNAVGMHAGDDLAGDFTTIELRRTVVSKGCNDPRPGRHIG